ncbi:hypothetical protein TNCV_4391 [Trichonephila clavipes]|nr:hypothetical protein TNCV_4391 [Trichonephila clavipes]
MHSPSSVLAPPLESLINPQILTRWPRGPFEKDPLTSQDLKLVYFSTNFQKYPKGHKLTKNGSHHGRQVDKMVAKNYAKGSIAKKFTMNRLYNVSGRITAHRDHSDSHYYISTRIAWNLTLSRAFGLEGSHSTACNILIDFQHRYIEQLTIQNRTALSQSWSKKVGLFLSCKISLRTAQQCVEYHGLSVQRPLLQLIFTLQHSTTIRMSVFGGTGENALELLYLISSDLKVDSCALFQDIRDVIFGKDNERLHMLEIMTSISN